MSEGERRADATPEPLRARIVLRQPVGGGRTSPLDLRGGYRPHLRVADGPLLGVEITSGAPSTIRPGEAASVVVVRLYEIDYSSLRVGARFAILEGTREVGAGVVLAGPADVERHAQADGT